jgi:hypothetical protein
MSRWKLAGSLGWHGVIGALLLAASAFAYLLLVLPRDAEAQRLEQTLAAAQARLEQTRGAQTVEAAPLAQLEAFYAHFPPKGDVSGALRQIYGAAARNQVELAQAEYRLIPERELRLLRYQLNVPVKGSYSQIRSFAADVLRDLPFASLDDINLQREAIGNPRVEARLRFSLYLRDGG